jgi:hypothetical protein
MYKTKINNDGQLEYYKQTVKGWICPVSDRRRATLQKICENRHSRMGKKLGDMKFEYYELHYREREIAAQNAGVRVMRDLEWAKMEIESFPIHGASPLITFEFIIIDMCVETSDQNPKLALWTGGYAIEESKFRTLFEKVEHNGPSHWRKHLSVLQRMALYITREASIEAVCTIQQAARIDDEELRTYLIKIISEVVEFRPANVRTSYLMKIPPVDVCRTTAFEQSRAIEFMKLVEESERLVSPMKRDSVMFSQPYAVHPVVLYFFRAFDVNIKRDTDLRSVVYRRLYQIDKSDTFGAMQSMKLTGTLGVYLSAHEIYLQLVNLMDVCDCTDEPQRLIEKKDLSRLIQSTARRPNSLGTYSEWDLLKTRDAVFNLRRKTPIDPESIEYIYTRHASDVWISILSFTRMCVGVNLVYSTDMGEAFNEKCASKNFQKTLFVVPNHEDVAVVRALGVKRKDTELQNRPCFISVVPKEALVCTSRCEVEIILGAYEEARKSEITDVVLLCVQNMKFRNLSEFFKRFHFYYTSKNRSISTVSLTFIGTPIQCNSIVQKPQTFWSTLKCHCSNNKNQQRRDINPQLNISVVEPQKT